MHIVIIVELKILECACHFDVIKGQSRLCLICYYTAELCVCI